MTGDKFKNVVLIVDTRNIMACLGMTFNHGKLNYQEYIKTAIGDDVLFAGIAYGCEQNGNESRFVSSLKHMGMDTKFRPPLTKVDPKTQQTISRWVNWNVAITLDVLRLIASGNVDKVILGSSEPELVDLIEHLKERNVKVEVYACGIPKVLKTSASGYKEISKDLLFYPPEKVADPDPNDVF